MISVILPVLNEASCIESALQNLVKLEGDFEVIVVDGGSDDDTVSAAQRYATVLRSEKGRAAQMNAGARAAKGDVLLFLHADTQLPDKSFLQIEKTMLNPTFVGGRFRVGLDSHRFVIRVVEFSINLRDRLIGGFTGDQAIFIRRQAFEEIGGYKEIPLMEDLDLGRRMLKLGKVVRLPLAVRTSARRWEKDGAVRTVLLMWTLRFSYFIGVSPSTLAKFYANTR